MTQLMEQAIQPLERSVGQKVAVLMDLGRVLTRTAALVETNCPACASNTAPPKHEMHSICYVECSQGRALQGDFVSQSLSSDMWIVARKRMH